jgi:hypothetical protein
MPAPRGRPKPWRGPYRLIEEALDGFAAVSGGILAEEEVALDTPAAAAARLTHWFRIGFGTCRISSRLSNPKIRKLVRNAANIKRRGGMIIDGLEIFFDRVGELNLPPNPAKESDKRYQEYISITGQTDSWELDALSPAYIDELVDSAVAD